MSGWGQDDVGYMYSFGTSGYIKSSEESEPTTDQYRNN